MPPACQCDVEWCSAESKSCMVNLPLYFKTSALRNRYQLPTGHLQCSFTRSRCHLTDCMLTALVHSTVTAKSLTQFAIQAVEATADAEELVYKSSLEEQAQPIIPITGYVVILTMCWAVHGENNWQGESVSAKFGDHTVWGTEFLDRMLRFFFSVAQAKSFPTLEQFAWQVDKVTLLCCLCPAAHEDSFLC